MYATGSPTKKSKKFLKEVKGFKLYRSSRKSTVA